MLHSTHKARTLAIIDGFGSGLVAVLGPGEPGGTWSDTSSPNMSAPGRIRRIAT